jgi:hypothetical protein
MRNGKVLVTGGECGSPCTVRDSAELYDPQTGTWTATGSMHAARSHHTATLLQDGTVLVAGLPFNCGASCASEPSAEVYDRATGKWRATGNMAVPRSYHTATLLPDGHVLVTGGGLGPDALASTELYDPQTGTWSSASLMSTHRSMHTATLLPNGQVLVAGGEGYLQGAPMLSYDLASAELYAPASAVAILSRQALDFGTQGLRSPSPTYTITLTTGGSPLLITTVSLDLTHGTPNDFIVNDTCRGVTLAPGGNCTLRVTFIPMALGPRRAAIRIADNAAGSPQTIALNGVGVRDTSVIGRWTLARGIAPAHTGQTAIRLADGRVLVFG